MKGKWQAAQPVITLYNKKGSNKGLLAVIFSTECNGNE